MALESQGVQIRRQNDGNFIALGQTVRNWLGMAAAPNGNVYAGVNGGDIYMQTAGAGNFNALSQTVRLWWCMAAAPNGNVYAAVLDGDIYMQTGGTGNFNPLSQTVRSWRGMAAAPNGNVYACVENGDIYMQTGGTGNFNPLSQTVRSWRGMAAAPNGNAYVCVSGGDIYMQKAGIGNFNALSQTSRVWVGMAAAPNGNIYACVENGDIYMQTGGTGNFNALSQTSRAWYGMAAAPNGNVYAGVNGGDIYMQKAAQTIAATIAFNAGTTSITRSDIGGSFITDGFTTAMRVENNSTVNSTRIHTLASVAATVMTTFEPIITQSTGISITITGYVMETIGQITGYTGPQISCSKLDTTDLNSTAKTFIPSLRDSGDVSLDMVFADESTILHRSIRNDLERRKRRVYDIKLTDQSTNSTSQPSAFYFDAYVTAFSLSGSVDNIIKGSITLGVSSAIKTIDKVV